jgi:hypothetical protein
MCPAEIAFKASKWAYQILKSTITAKYIAISVPSNALENTFLSVKCTSSAGMRKSVQFPGGKKSVALC